ncbi:MAG: PD40 domain-containing protein [Chloroflexi bacterium]|nr:PD40 domain-containing protein [Chloroflexota bacterium]
MKLRLTLCALLLWTAACQGLAAPTATPTATATATVTATLTASATPTQSATATASATPTPTATITQTPSLTPIPSATPHPSLTPQPTVSVPFDNWELFDVIEALEDGISTPLIAFLNQNNRETIRNLSTAQPQTDNETLYYVAPDGSFARTAVLSLTAPTNNQLYISRNGLSIAYFRDDPAGFNSGLYVVDLRTGFSSRFLALASLVQRGIFSVPAWTADGRRLAIALATGYDMDIFSVGVDGSGWQNLTAAGSYEWWPSWSADGRYLLFVSDRARCPSWIPGDTNACDALSTPPPSSGNVFVLDTATNELRQIADIWVNEAPQWVNNTTIAFASGDPLLGDSERRLWLADARSGQLREVRLPNGSDGPLRLSPAWSADGRRVLFQSAGTAAEIIMMGTDGILIGRTSELNFARFSMAAAWSPDGTRVAIGGVEGQCPYGIIVYNEAFESVRRGTPPPSMCNPAFSPDSLWLAFSGLISTVDGRVDIYVANNNGGGAVNLTSDLRGQTDFVGWVGG